MCVSPSQLITAPLAKGYTPPSHWGAPAQAQTAAVGGFLFLERLKMFV